MDVLPYPPRPNQLQFVKLVEDVAKSKGHLVLESGTGTGKTVCALSGAIQEALAHGRKVLYLTRTNSQEEQVMRELRRINEKVTGLRLALQGRQVTCPLIRTGPGAQGRESGRAFPDLRREKEEGPDQPTWGMPLLCRAGQCRPRRGGEVLPGQPAYGGGVRALLRFEELLPA